MTHRDPACLELFARLSAYVDGELPPADCAEIERHIADCPPCVDFIRSLRGSVEAARHFETTAAPAPIPPELESRLQQAWRAALARRQG
jgi:RNA polymerase sigma-70 factor (ECF subfamily)